MTTELDEMAYEIGVGLISRVRHDQPAELAAHLETLDPELLRRIAVVLAELVPEDRSVNTLLRWKRQRGQPRRLRPLDEIVPCGTPAGYLAHAERGDLIDPACGEAYAGWKQRAA